MNYYLLKDFSKILKKNHQDVRTALGKDTNVMRVYDKAIEAIKVTVDIYANYALVQDYGDDEKTQDEIQAIIDTVSSSLYVAKDKVVYKKRKKGQENTFDETIEPLELKVIEDGASYFVELRKKADTGLYLDNYRARLLVKELSYSLSVLNLFAYTGAYSVEAARGGAKRVVSVDTSRLSLDIARRNMKENGFFLPSFDFIQEDVKKYLGSCNEKFDLVIFDAPSFSNAHKGRRENFDIQKDHVPLLKQISLILNKEGIVLFRTNLSSFNLDRENLSEYKIFNYTKEMVSPGFTRKSQVVKTYVLKAYNIKKKYYGEKNGIIQKNKRILFTKDKRQKNKY